MNKKNCFQNLMKLMIFRMLIHLRFTLRISLKVMYNIEKNNAFEGVKYEEKD